MPTMPEALTVPIPEGAIGLVLPLPVSVNHNRRVRPVQTKKGLRHIPVKTKQANAWSEAAGWELRRRYPGVACPPLPLAVHVRLLVRSKGRLDTDNVGKVLLDALIPPLGVDDEEVMDWRVTKVILPPRKGGPVRCEVIISTMEEQAMPAPEFPIGMTVVLPDGPWAGKELLIVGKRQPPPDRTGVPIQFYALKRLDTGEIGHRDGMEVLNLLMKQYAPRATPRRGKGHAKPRLE